MTDDSSDTDESEADLDPPYERTYPDKLLEQGRERGLSKADREYLASGGETIAESENAHINIRHRIRSRIRESIVDFWLLTEYLSERDRHLVFREGTDDWDNWELQIGIKSAIQLFYTALGQSDLADFDAVLTSAIHDAERRESSGPVLVDVDFDVEVDEQFHVQETYDKFQRGVPLSPMEIGTLLVTGRVHDPEEVQELSHHARSNSFIEHTVAPLLEEQLSSIGDGDERFDRFWYVWSHLSDEYPPESGAVPYLSDYEYLEDEIAFQQHKADDVALEDLADEEVAEELDDGESAAQEDGGDHPHETALRELSADLDEPITVGDEVVYEDGDRHTIGGDGRNGDEPVDADR